MKRSIDRKTKCKHNKNSKRIKTERLIKIPPELVSINSCELPCDKTTARTNEISYLGATLYTVRDSTVELTRLTDDCCCYQSASNRLMLLPLVVVAYLDCSYHIGSLFTQNSDTIRNVRKHVSRKHHRIGKMHLFLACFFVFELNSMCDNKSERN